MTLKALIVLYLFLNIKKSSSIYPFPKCRFREWDKNYFCKREYSCMGSHRTNTGCSRAPCGPTKSCGTLFKPIPMTRDDRQFIVHVHNTYRNRLATGLEFRYPLRHEREEIVFGPISNMKVMAYNVELEFLAQCWANNCLYNGWSDVHDKCKKSQIFSEVGQNFFLYTHVTPLTERIDYTHQTYLTKAMDTWFQEIHKYNYEKHLNFSSNPETNNFTQMMWATTGYVGCARTQYGHGRVLRLLIYCNYGNKGNEEGQPVFLESKNGSSCCDNCEGRITYYYLFEGHMTHRRGTEPYESHFPNADKKLRQFQEMGLDISNKVEVALTTHIYIFPGCNLNYSCLCGMDKDIDKVNEYFLPPFQIASGNIFKCNKIVLFLLLLFHTGRYPLMNLCT